MGKRMSLRKAILCLLLLFLLLCFSPASAASKQTYIRGQSVLLIARIQDDLNNPIPGVRLQFEDQTDNVYLGDNITDASGVASIMWNTSSSSLGPHVIHVWNIEHQDLYVEESHAYLEVHIITPAELSFSVQSPGAVKPGERFVITVIVENLGEASIKDVIVTLGDQRHNIGTIDGGGNSKTSFGLIAPEAAGNYIVQGSIRGEEEGTGKVLQKSFKVSYRVKIEGFGISISAPSNVEENENFDFLVMLNNIGEDSLKIDVEVVLSGAAPKNFHRTVTLPPGESKAIYFSAKAGTGDLLTITATGTAGNLRESDQVSINVLHPPQLLAPSQPPSPALLPSQTPAPLQSPEPRSLPPITTENPPVSTTPSKTSIPSETSPRTTPEAKESIPESPPPTHVIGERKPYSLNTVVTIALVILLFIRRIWKVEEP